MVYFQPSTDKHGTNDIKSDYNRVLQPAPNVSPLQIQDTPEAQRNNPSLFLISRALQEIANG